MDINTITPGSRQGLSQLLFWLQAERAHRADLRLCSSPDFTFSSLIVWGNVCLSVNIFHFHSLITWNIWLTVTKSTVWVISGFWLQDISYLSLIPPPFFSGLLCRRTSNKHLWQRDDYVRVLLLGLWVKEKRNINRQ